MENIELNCSIEALNKKIERENEKFAKMSKPQKRVKIAEDCIARIMAEQIIAEQGNLIEWEVDDWYEPEFKKKSIYNILQNNKTSVCSACAKGAMLMSYIGRVNEMETADFTNDLEYDKKPMQKLIEIFPKTQLDLMEIAFERSVFPEWQNLKGLSQDRIDAALEFNRNHHYGTDDLMIAICNNIIENKGNFIP